MERVFEYDETLLNHHVRLILLHQDIEDLLRVNKFEQDVRNEVIFIRERVEIMVEESRVEYESFRPMVNQ